MAGKSNVAAAVCANPVRKLLSTSICIALAVGSASTTLAATLTVTSNADAGTGSLRAAVANASPGDTINFQAGLASPITLTTGQIGITKALAITGPGANLLTVSGNNVSRIFYANGLIGTSHVTISGLTLTGGHVTGAGGAVSSVGPSFSLQDSIVSNNTASSGGGGIYASCGSGATLTLSGVTLQGNTAGGSGGGAYMNCPGGTSLVTNSLVTGNTSTAATAGFGGGLALGGGSTSTSQVTGTRVTNNQAYCCAGIAALYTSLTISDGEISGNTAGVGGGGGLGAKAIVLTMTRTVVSGNTAGKRGGGISLDNASGASNIQYSTISHNIAATSGGGLSFRFKTSAGVTTTLTNSTVAGNTAAAYGGGVYSTAGGTTGTVPLKIESSTIAGNSAATGGGVVALSSGGTQGFLHNAIVANNAANTADPDTSGAFTASFNLVYAPGSAILTGSNNTTGVNPQLGSLGNYGGTTPSKLPKTGSPVLDAGDPALTALTSDQRGLTRVVGAHIDIGADERQATEDTIFLDGLEGY